jgi:CubicO group peptidase (beta-lactamase class C family)
MTDAARLTPKRRRAIAIAAVGAMVTRPIQILTTYFSRELCSSVFVSRLDPAQDYAERIATKPGMHWLNWAVRYRVDRSKQEVTASLLGLFRNRAIYHDGLGTLRVRDGEPAEALFAESDCTPAGPANAALSQIAGPDLVEPSDPRLRAALDHAFAEPARPPYRRTKAVLVVHDGRVVAERYAPGYGIESPILGYSCAKSVTSALIGILVSQGRLSLDGPAPVPEWTDPTDPRHAITINDLLRMTSGLAIPEPRMPMGRGARMFFLERDMGAFAAESPLQATPGTVWEYTSANTMILSRIVRETVGGRASDVLRFARHELFSPLGMRNVTIEFDATGTPIGGGYIFATARDWARFGLLYLNDGVAGGRRILPEGWVRYSSTPTLDSGYGAGFWTNRVKGDLAQWHIPWEIPGAPDDTISARGNMGQFVIVIPSKRLVIVRFGISHARDIDHKGVGQLVENVIAALEQHH